MFTSFQPNIMQSVIVTYAISPQVTPNNNQANFTFNRENAENKPTDTLTWSETVFVNWNRSHLYLNKAVEQIKCGLF